MAARALAGPRLPDGRRVRARHDVLEHAPPQHKDTRRSGRAGDPAGTPPHANHPRQVQNAGARLLLLQDCFASPRDRIAVGTPFAAAGARWLRLPRLNRTNTLWVKAAAFLAGMWDAFPRRRWYLKADEDTLLLPRSLARFFEACTAALPSQRPAYLGDVASTPAAGAAALP